MAAHIDTSTTSRFFLCGEVGPHRIAVECTGVESITDDPSPAGEATLRLQELLAVTSPQGDDDPRGLVLTGSAGPVFLAGSGRFRLKEIPADAVHDVPLFVRELGETMGFTGIFSSDEGFVFVLDVNRMATPMAEKRAPGAP